MGAPLRYTNMYCDFTMLLSCRCRGRAKEKLVLSCFEKENQFTNSLPKFPCRVLSFYSGEFSLTLTYILNTQLSRPTLVLPNEGTPRYSDSLQLRRDVLWKQKEKKNTYHIKNNFFILPVTPTASNSHSEYSSDDLRPQIPDHSALRPVGVGRK